MKTTLLIFAIFLLSLPCFSQVVFAPGVGYYQNAREATQPNSVDTETTQSRVDMKLGYVLPMGLYVGGMYSLLNQEDCVGNTCTDSSGFYAGPTFGYQSLTGFYALFTYHILGEVGDDSKQTGAKGPQVDLGWIFPLTSYFAIGPQLTYRSIEFEKVEQNGVSQDADIKESSIAPYVSLWFMF